MTGLWHGTQPQTALSVHLSYRSHPPAVFTCTALLSSPCEESFFHAPGALAPWQWAPCLCFLVMPCVTFVQHSPFVPGPLSTKAIWSTICCSLWSHPLGPAVTWALSGHHLELSHTWGRHPTSEFKARVWTFAKRVFLPLRKARLFPSNASCSRMRESSLKAFQQNACFPHYSLSWPLLNHLVRPMFVTSYSDVQCKR